MGDKNIICNHNHLISMIPKYKIMCPNNNSFIQKKENETILETFNNMLLKIQDFSNIFNKQNDYLKIMEKFSKFVIQIEEYEKSIKELKEENAYLKNVINSNNYFYNDVKSKNDNNEYLEKIDFLTQQLNLINKEYENYKITTEKKFKLFNSKNKLNDFCEEISELKKENLNLKNEYQLLLNKFENSDLDYANLLRRNENLNRELFKLRSYISSKKLINPFFISHFSITLINMPLRAPWGHSILNQALVRIRKPTNGTRWVVRPLLEWCKV